MSKRPKYKYAVVGGKISSKIALNLSYINVFSKKNQYVGKYEFTSYFIKPRKSFFPAIPHIFGELASRFLFCWFIIPV